MTRQNPFVDLAQAELVSRLAAFWGAARAAHFFNAPPNWLSAGASAHRHLCIRAVRESHPMHDNGSRPAPVSAPAAGGSTPAH
jgi:hypothetical protein